MRRLFAIFVSLLVCLPIFDIYVYAAEININCSGVTCEQCGARLTSSYLGRPATCTSWGVQYYQCTCRGGAEVRHPPLGHILQEYNTPPTCTTVGKFGGSYCARSECREIFEEPTIVPALGHSCFVDEAVAPTCTKTGLTEGSRCSRCNEVLVKQEVIPATGHTYTSSILTHPTCTSTGLVSKVCHCGDVVTEKISTLKHTVSKYWMITKQPTDTETGERAKYCIECNSILKSQFIDSPCEHIEVIDEAVAPTCSKTGLTQGSHCSKCNSVIVKQKIVPTTKHTEGVSEKVEPSCTKIGLTQGSHCIVCNLTIKKQEIIPAIGYHTEVIDKRIGPTCTEAGLTWGSHCSVCNEVINKQREIPPNGHTEVVDEAIPATCTETGLTKGKHCCVCNEVLVAQEVAPVIDHTYKSEITTPSTCIEQGVITYTCSCGDSYTEPAPLSDHTEVIDEAVAPSCTETGLTEGKHCSVCGVITKSQKLVQVTDHKIVIDEAVAPTCTQTGLTLGKHCLYCNEVLVKQEVLDTVPHTYKREITTQSTCIEQGVITYTCSCGDSYTEPAPLAGHTEVIDEAVAPTCTSTGLTAGKHCSVCGEVLVKQQIVSATGHNAKTTGKKSATYFKKGYTGDKVCTTCGEVITKGKAIAKLKLKTPNVKITAGNKKFNVRYTKVKDATGFQVRYKLKGKTNTKTYSTKKSVSKAIKKLEKGNCKVQVRAFIKQGNKKAYSTWTKAKSVKIK